MRDDLERFACRVDKALRQDIEQIKMDTTHLGNRLETLEQRFDDTIPSSQLRDKCSAQDQQIEALICQLDDYVNCSCRSTFYTLYALRANIRIRGLPTATAAKKNCPYPAGHIQGDSLSLLQLN